MPDYAARLRSRLVPEGDCLVYPLSTNGAGYGKMWVGDKLMLTHRFAYEVAYGPIPEGMKVCHECDNPRCCNVKHLFLGTQSDNLADMRAKGRLSHGPSHSEAIRSGWTPELRAGRAEQTRRRMREEHLTATQAAGVPFDWKYCPKCATWKAPHEYHRNKARHDGLANHCKPCRSEVSCPA